MVSSWLYSLLRGGGVVKLWFDPTVNSGAGNRSHERLRDLTVLFVEDVVLLDAAISQISADYFGGRCILFVDCAEKLRNRQEMASQPLEDLQSASARIGPS
jgi:hypothetical protein